MSTVPAPIGVIAHYNLLESLESSGPGDLYRARDTRKGRTVVIRVLPAGFTSGGATGEALLEQARGLNVLSHPNITTLFDAGVHEGRVYLVFEFLTGQSLRVEMAGRAMNVRRALEIGIQIADALADAQAAGFVHGGLSPDSIVITAKGHAKVPAFELASRWGFDSASPDARLHDYDSPEEAKGQPADDRSDIYSVGAVLYEMLTTRRPHYKGASAPSASNRNVPVELDEVALKALAPNPDARYQNAAIMAAELRRVSAMLDRRDLADDEAAAAAPPANLLGLAITGGLVLIGLAVLAWWLFAT